VISFRARLALVHLAVIVAVLAATAAAAYWGLSRAVHGQLDSALLSLAQIEAAMMAADPQQPARVHEVAAGPAHPSFSFVRLDRLVQIVDARGDVLARSSNLGNSHLPIDASLIAHLSDGVPVFQTLHGFGEEPVRMVSVPVGSGAGIRVVQVAGSLDDVNNVVDSASVLFIAMGVALMAAVGAAGALLTRRAFRAIDDVVEQARRIDPQKLSARLPHPSTNDEIGRLVDTLNDMLARIEHAFEAQRRFTADASHELRSPLSRLRTELEVTLRKPREPAAYVQALRSCVDEAERLTVLVEELLMLARLDSGQENEMGETVRLDEVAREVVDRHLAGAAASRIELLADTPATVTARFSRSAAQLAISNLVDNALKFTPPGGEVTVRVYQEAQQAMVSVADTGPGIPAGDLAHVFERFYRGSAARASDAPGFGLGLALSRSLAERHGGHIEATNGMTGGAVFTLRLPLEFHIAPTSPSRAPEDAESTGA